MSYIKDEERASALLVGIFAQAAHDALRGSRSAREWLALNDVPATSWPLVAKVQATQKLAPREKRRHKVA